MNQFTRNYHLVRILRDGFVTLEEWHGIYVVNTIFGQLLLSRFCHTFVLVKGCIFNHFNPVFHFSTPWKLEKTKGFLTFLGGRKVEHLVKMSWIGAFLVKHSLEKYYPWFYLNRDNTYMDLTFLFAFISSL